jgi:cardiolipin synthase
MKDLALFGCIFGAFTDWLDGYIAKNYNQKSIWGGILDPVADKVFVASIAIGLTMKELFPYELLGITIGRDVVLIGAGLIIRGIEKDKDKPFFDAQSATFEIVPTNLSKVFYLNLKIVLTE